MSFGSRLLDVLFPPKCAFCGRLLPDGVREICPECEKELPRTRGKMRKIDFIPRVISPLRYEALVREALLRYKFRAAPARGRVYGRMIARELADLGYTNFDCVTWVPLSRRRLHRRGYDQARILAEEVAKALDKPCEKLLNKSRNVRPQSSLRSADARRANVSGCYTVPTTSRAEGKRLLLIDDIVTTGATLSECARMLMLAGAAEVTAATVASAINDK